MGLNPFTVALLSVALAALVAYAWLRRSAGLFTGRRARLPRTLETTPVDGDAIPIDARAPLDYLAQRLGGLGFARAGGPVRVPAFERTGHRLLLVPFVHEDEGTYFFMGIEAGVAPRSELMLHIVTPLTEARRVETSTLPSLGAVRPPADVDLRVVIDADSIEEIWSRHRRALTEYERKERAGASEGGWSTCVAETYQDWLQAAVRAHRLVLDPGQGWYRVRPRSGGVA
jgi:hypothetical protein